ncbi:MAG: hypothetical protein ACLR6B_04065 [Blautia sp.]
MTHTDRTVVVLNNNRKDEMDRHRTFIGNGLAAYSFDEDIDSLYENGLSDT